MAQYTYIASSDRWEGLSTDTLPTNVPQGTKAYQTDKAIKMIKDKSGSWVQEGPARIAPTDSLSNAIGIDAVAFNMVWNGATWDRLRQTNVHKFGNPTASGDNAIWTPTSGKKFRLLGISLQCGATDVNVVFKDGSTAISPTLYGKANQWMDLSALFQRSNGILSAAANNVLNLNLSAGNPVAVWLAGLEE
ncbi:MAG TPA: hypothetical protein VN426_06050 [Syntrophomonadaceae bacterium]|nr:hypothetical protein [Syntrophomonadaceae bacterium]